MEIIARSSIVFFMVFLLTRGMRRRSLADMAPFEMVLLVVLGDIIQQGVMQQDYSVTGSILALASFGFWLTVVTFVTWKSKTARTILDGVPIVLVAVHIIGAVSVWVATLHFALGLRVPLAEQAPERELVELRG